ncbi:UNVERIFIED_ORG: hypothetical protein DFO49_2916 [Herbaspirillum seropedicae]
MRAPRATPARQPLSTEVKKPGGRLHSVVLSCTQYFTCGVAEMSFPDRVPRYG